MGLDTLMPSPLVLMSTRNDNTARGVERVLTGASPSGEALVAFPYSRKARYSVADIKPLAYNLNRLAGTLDDRGIPTLSAQGAAQKWSGTTLALQGALNTKAGNPRTEWVGVQEVLNQLAGTFGLGMDAASSLIES